MSESSKNQNIAGHEFRYIEFIRNPKKDIRKTNVEDNIRCIALDYFDIIYTKEVDTLKKCMVSENDIPCEAYQSLGIFREKKKNLEEERDPFNVNEEYPFFAVLQVTLTPEAYVGSAQNIHIESMKELEQAFSKAQWSFVEEGNRPMKAKYGIYYTVNTMDFCIVLASNRLDFAAYLSNRIKMEYKELNGKRVSKYAVYTVMGIYKGFKAQDKVSYMEQDTVLVTRVLLKRNLYGGNLRSFKNLLEDNSQIEISTHSLPGRYELSIRIDGAESILKVLPQLLSYILDTFSKSDHTSAPKESENFRLEDGKTLPNGCSNIIEWLIKTETAQYLNIRIFFQTAACYDFEIEDTMSLSEVLRKPDFRIEEIYKHLFEYAKEKKMLGKLGGYFDKLHNIIHTYIALYPQYDTNISIKMLGDFLMNFMQLLQMHLEFTSDKKEDVNDIAKNFLYAINYFQQYVKVISSVNSSSFQAPKYEIEKDECCIVKLPIAYSQFSTEIFGKYYKTREKRNDEEFRFFPKYIPLVIPYMQNGDSDFMMMTLLGQNMADAWNLTKDYWEKHLSKNEILIFIICQDMNEYKKVSDIIISTFHELGHYCNSLTRKERNSDIIKILSEEIAKRVVNRTIFNSKVSYQKMLLALHESYVIQWLYECIYDEIVSYFEHELKSVIDFPKAIFLERFMDHFRNLTNEMVNEEDGSAFDEDLMEEFFDEMAIRFGHLSIGENLQQKIESTQRFFDEKLDEVEEEIRICMQKLDDNSPREKIEKYISLRKKVDSILKMKDTEENKKAETIGSLTTEYDRVSRNLKQDTKQFIDGNGLKLIHNLNAYNILLKYQFDFIEHCVISETAKASTQIDKNTDLKEYAKKKETMLDNIGKRYFSKLSDKMAVSTNISDKFLVMFRKMHISEESNMREFKAYLNQAVSGLFVSEDVMELAQSNYEESIADIVMCANLDLEFNEYLRIMLDMLDKNDNKFRQNAPRVIIVVTYLLYIKDCTCDNFEDIKKNIYGNLENDFKNKIHKNFWEHENLKNEANVIEEEIFKKDAELLEILERELIDIRGRKLFIITLERIFYTRKEFRFIEKGEQDFEQIQTFVKANLKRKSYKNIQDESFVEDAEIDFILRYYYKNRIAYANSPDTKEDPNGC